MKQIVVGEKYLFVKSGSVVKALESHKTKKNIGDLWTCEVLEGTSPGKLIMVKPSALEAVATS